MARSASCERRAAVERSSLPSNVTVPESAAMRPVTHLAKVVLPLPDSPTRPKVSPRLRLSEMSCTAVSRLRPSLKVRLTSPISSTSPSVAPLASRLVASTGVMRGISGTCAEK